RLKAVLPGLRTTVVEALPGEAVHELRAARYAGALARSLQRAPFGLLDPYDHHHHLRDALGKAEAIVTVAPHLETDVARLQRRLLAKLPRPGTLVPAHGEYHADQLLVRPGGVALTGFDRICLAAP